jgi:hypothetical protein
MAFLQERKRAYSLVFDKNNAADQIVLRDLARFCYANRSCFAADERVHSAREGRREVWLRIQQHLNLTEADLYSLYGGVPVSPATLATEDDDE